MKDGLMADMDSQQKKYPTPILVDQSSPLAMVSTIIKEDVI